MKINDIARPDGPDGETFTFSNIGDQVQGKVVHFDTFTRTNKFNQKDERVLVITLEQPDGSNQKIWPVVDTDVNGDGWASRQAKAIVAAIKAAGEDELREGATLAVKYSEDIPTDFGNPAKGFQAEYKAPQLNGASADGAVSGLISGGGNAA